MACSFPSVSSDSSRKKYQVEITLVVLQPSILNRCLLPNCPTRGGDSELPSVTVYWSSRQAAVIATSGLQLQSLSITRYVYGPNGLLRSPIFQSQGACAISVLQAYTIINRRHLWASPAQSRCGFISIYERINRSRTHLLDRSNVVGEATGIAGKLSKSSTFTCTCRPRPCISQQCSQGRPCPRGNDAFSPLFQISSLPISENLSDSVKIYLQNLAFCQEIFPFSSAKISDDFF